MESPVCHKRELVVIEKDNLEGCGVEEVIVANLRCAIKFVNRCDGLIE